MSPQPLVTPPEPQRGARLYDTASLAGVLFFILAPAVLLLTQRPVVWAAACGYLGIAVFVGGVAARYSFIERPSPLRQLAWNTLIASIISGFFFLVSLVLFVL
jgi:hypothetical protein